MSSVTASFRGTGTRQEEGGICLRAFAQGSHGQSVVENPPANAGDIGDMGLIPGSGRSPGVGSGNPL